MRDLATTALDLLPPDVGYADVRTVHRRHEGVHVQDRRVSPVVDSESAGIGLRVLIDGQWGFAATSRTERAALDGLVATAVGQARAAAGAGGVHRGLGDPVTTRAVWAGPVGTDPFSVGLAEKVHLLLQACKLMANGASGGCRVVAEASMDFFRDEKVFANTEGALVEQTITESGAGLMATATGGGDVQRRSYPQSVPRAIRGQRGDFATAGYEHVLGLDLLGHAGRVGAEAAALLTAPACPSETTTLIVSGTQMAQLVHETAGHAMEADRLLGTEASLSGATYATPDRRGGFRFGSELVTVFADATMPGGLGSFGFDDEGVPGQRVDLVRDGVFRGYLSGRESAAAIGEAPTGASRADGWARVPLVRMTNVCLAPGESSLAEMIAGTERGVLIDMNRTLSIDDVRLSFRFGAEIGWEIRDGRVGRMLRNCSYSGITPHFWAGCDAVGGPGEFRLYGIPSCNKGEPLQVAHIGHGTVPARFRNVRVGWR